MVQFFNVKRVFAVSIFIVSGLMYASNRAPKAMRYVNVSKLEDLRVFKAGRPSHFSRDVVRLLESNMGMGPHEMDVIAACLGVGADSQARYDRSV